MFSLKYIHPRKLTWNQKMMIPNRNLLFQNFIFRFHVSFWGVYMCIYIYIDLFESKVQRYFLLMIPASKWTPRYRCARFLPIHGENFGGFFLAALTKVAEAPGIEAVPRSELITPKFTSEEMPVAWSGVVCKMSPGYFFEKTVGDPCWETITKIPFPFS